MKKESPENGLELAKLKAKYEAMAKGYQEHKARGNDPAFFVPGAVSDPLPSPSDHQDVEVFLKKHQHVLNATESEVAYGTVVDRAGSHALLHVGDGLHVIHDFGTVQAVPQIGANVRTKQTPSGCL